MRLWRLTPARRAAKAYDGEGARLFGGRWNDVGTAVVYLSERLSLAALELLVHADPSVLRGLYKASPLEVPDVHGLIEDVGDPAALSPDWRAPSAPLALKAYGDAWAAQGRSVLLQVPSVIIPNEPNFLLNPAHPDFAKLRRFPPVDFRFDPRLYRT
jgi:RES domain-containing protein